MTHVPLLKRIRSEYLEMPGLRVTLEQGQRLFGLEWTLCKAVFDALVEEQFLRVNTRGMYVRASDGVEAQSTLSNHDVEMDPRIAVAS